MTQTLCKSTLGLVIPRQKLTLLSCACCTKRFGKLPVEMVGEQAICFNSDGASRSSGELCPLSCLHTAKKPASIGVQVSILVKQEIVRKFSQGVGRAWICTRVGLLPLRGKSRERARRMWYAPSFALVRQKAPHVVSPHSKNFRRGRASRKVKCASRNFEMRPMRNPFVRAI